MQQSTLYKVMKIDPSIYEKIHYFILYYDTLSKKMEGKEIADPELNKHSEELLEIL